MTKQPTLVPALFALLLLTPGCGDRTEGGLYIAVLVPQGLASKSVQVVATGGGLRAPSSCMKVDDRRRLTVGASQGALPEAVTLDATGYLDDACQTPTSPPETATAQARFRSGQVGDVTLLLDRATPVQELVCDNDLDDDGDGQVDCQDFDCNGRTCTNGNRCITGLTCQGGQCLGGEPVVCGPPPTCFLGPGICVPELGCRYTPAESATCDDGDPCTENDRCDAAGQCAGVPKPCSDPPDQCHEATGTCTANGCQYALRTGDCDDNDFCTTQDTCGADGVCVGTPVVCAERDCREADGTCTADGECNYRPRPAATLCTDGVCNDAGGCIPLWNYTLSNVLVTQVPTLPDGPVTLGCGETRIDTGSTPPTVTNWCAGQPDFGWAVVSQLGGLDAMVLSFRDLDISGGATLRLTGSRPAIIVADGNVRVLGDLLAESGAQACAGGGAGGDGAAAAGAGGGAYGSVGAAGGTGFVSPSAGAGGSPEGSPDLKPLRGGCAGGPGSSAAPAAVGGGAVQISANGTLTVVGTVTAPGAGGRGGVIYGGGGGGSSGGAVLLEAQQLVLVDGAAVTANGGSGGQGGGITTTGQDGAAGAQRTATPAAGGDSPTTGASGGNGAAGSVGATGGGDNAASGGGGGGGGVGRLRFNASLGCNVGTLVVVSPAATSNGTPGCP